MSNIQTWWRDLDLASKLSPGDKAVAEFRMWAVSPDDWKYAQKVIWNYLSNWAERKACAYVQLMLLQARRDMWLATDENVTELELAILKFDPLNASLIEKDVTKHDQLAVIEELWRHVSDQTKALLHPGTTSYDVLDTARSYMLKKVYEEQLRPTIATTIEKLINLSESLLEPTQDWKIRALQAGRTHLQDTSPVPFWVTIAWYAARLADRLSKADNAFSSLKWKVSWIVWTWSSVNMVIWDDKAIDFEKLVLSKLWLEPDYTATQIVQKESLVDVWNAISTLMWVLWDFANDMRLLYSTAIWEVSDRSWAERLWGSSADASKNNPINWENISWKVVVVQSWMQVLYAMIQSDLQRDLRWSVQARYQPNQMITETFESFVRANKALDTLSVNEDKMSENIKKIRNNPSEPLVAILRGEWWVHWSLWVWHDFVKEMAKRAKRDKRNLIEVCMEDEEFTKLFHTLSEDKKAILNWELEKYVWTSIWRARHNIAFSKWVVSRKVWEILAGK